MRAPSKGSSQVSPTWSGTAVPAAASSSRASGEKTAPGISLTLGAQRGGRGNGSSRRAAGSGRLGLGEHRRVALAEARVLELVARRKQALVAAAAAARAPGVGRLLARVPCARHRRAE